MKTLESLEQGEKQRFSDRSNSVSPGQMGSTTVAWM